MLRTATSNSSFDVPIHPNFHIHPGGSFTPETTDTTIRSCESTLNNIIVSILLSVLNDPKLTSIKQEDLMKKKKYSRPKHFGTQRPHGEQRNT